MERHHKFASVITTTVMPPLSTKLQRKATRLDVSNGSSAPFRPAELNTSTPPIVQKLTQVQKVARVRMAGLIN
jgi:hypothetical protein